MRNEKNIFYPSYVLEVLYHSKHIGLYNITCGVSRGGSTKYHPYPLIVRIMLVLTICTVNIRLSAHLTEIYMNFIFSQNVCVCTFLENRSPTITLIAPWLWSDPRCYCNHSHIVAPHAFVHRWYIHHYQILLQEWRFLMYYL